MPFRSEVFIAGLQRHYLIVYILQPQAFVKQRGRDDSDASAAAAAVAMPSRSELLAAGEHSLVQAIEHAGGFLAVAQVMLSPLSTQPL